MQIKKFIKDNSFTIGFLIIIFLLDRISKLYVIHIQKINNNSELFLSKFLDIQLIWNEGIAFGLLSFNEDLFYNILSVLIILILVFIIFEIKKNKGLKKYSFIMVLGGAVGNLTDRLVYKAVPDFIDFHVGNFHWFIFNIADVFITLGIMFLIFNELFVIKKKHD